MVRIHNHKSDQGGVVMVGWEVLGVVVELGGVRVVVG